MEGRDDDVIKMQEQGSCVYSLFHSAAHIVTVVLMGGGFGHNYVIIHSTYHYKPTDYTMITQVSFILLWYYLAGDMGLTACLEVSGAGAC